MSFGMFYHHTAANVYRVALADGSWLDVSKDTYWQLWHGKQKPQQEAAA